MKNYQIYLKKLYLLNLISALNRIECVSVCVCVKMCKFEVDIYKWKKRKCVRKMFPLKRDKIM